MQTDWRGLFDDFLGHLVVNTKDYGDMTLAQNLYGAQRLFLSEIYDGLEEGIRTFTILKARQLGISTISLALDLFWLAYHPGMQGALVTDTAGNLAKFRVIIGQLLKGLPKHLKIKYDKDNRDMLVFSNGSVLDYLVAGVKEKSSGKAVTLGTGRAYNFLHATECSNYGDTASYDSLMAALAQEHKDRLYIFESTARGFNLFYDMWSAAENDTETQKPIFIGWWAKESYRVARDSAVFQKYWDGVLTPEEQQKANICLNEYGVTVEPEQWAWYRWMSATRQSAEGSMASNYPFHAREAFVATGKGFFPVKMVSEQLDEVMKYGYPMRGYFYVVGEDFCETRVEHTTNINEADLRVWEEPVEHAHYVLGVDVAYGRDEDNDRNAVQVLRCYADRVIQVAEYCSPLVTPNQLAWVICHLAGNYKNCMINIEITGPGQAVKQELDHLKFLLSRGLLDRNLVQQSGMRDFFNKARYYLYHRPDSMGAGYAYFWKTGEENKQTIFNQTRDMYMEKRLLLKSGRLLREMQTIIQDGFRICASGANKDDLNMALCLAVKAYIEWVRTPLINQKRTFEAEERREENAKKPFAGFVNFIYNDHLKNMKEMREQKRLEAAWSEDGTDFEEQEDAGIDVDYMPSYEEGEDIYG